MKKLFTIIALMCVGAMAIAAQVAEVYPGSARRKAPGVKSGDAQTEVLEDVFVARTTRGGMLEEVLGDRKLTVDSLVVEGPLDEADCRTLWEASFYGKTTVFDLSKATFEQGRIEESAFYDKEIQEQDLASHHKVYCIQLRHLILGPGIDEIGRKAFYWAGFLEKVTFTAPVRKIGKQAFQNCSALGSRHAVVLPEGMEELDDFCFADCGRFVSVTLPSTLRRLGAYTLDSKSLTEITIPDGIEVMGEACLAYNAFDELVLPDKEILFENGGQLMSCYMMKRLVLPSSMTAVPEMLCMGCGSLADCHLPETVKTIGRFAFSECRSLPETFELHEGVERIEKSAFFDCESIEHLILPSTLEYIGAQCFLNCENLTEVHCKASVPPLCDYDNLFYPFDSSPGAEIVAVLGVPDGSEAQYRAAKGWDSFVSINGLSPESFGQFGGVDSAVADNGGAGITAAGESICIRAVAGETYMVCGADGRVVAEGVTSGVETRVAALPGIYVVKVGDTVCKLAL